MNLDSRPDAPWLLSTDFDGTLTDPSHPESLCPSLFSWIEETRKKRPLLWVINTGRDWPSLQAELIRRQVPFFPDWAILVERHIFQVIEGTIQPVSEWNDACDQAHAVLFKQVHPAFAELRKRLRSFPGLDLVEDIGSPLGLIARSDEQAEEIRPFIEAAIAPYPDLEAVRNSVYFRFGHIGYTKGSALTELGRRLGIPASRRIAAGDQYNDLHMLKKEVAAHLICPANAIAPVKDRVTKEGGQVAPSRYGTGVSEALRHLPISTPTLKVTP